MSETVMATLALAMGTGAAGLLIWKFRKRCVP